MSPSAGSGPEFPEWSGVDAGIARQVAAPLPGSGTPDTRKDWPAKAPRRLPGAGTQPVADAAPVGDAAPAESDAPVAAAEPPSARHEDTVVSVSTVECPGRAVTGSSPASTVDSPPRERVALSVPHTGPLIGSPSERPSGSRRGRIGGWARRRPRTVMVAVAATIVVAAVAVTFGVVAGSSVEAPAARQRPAGAPAIGERAPVVSGIPSAPAIPSASSGASPAGPASGQHATQGTAGTAATAAIPFQQATPTASDQFTGSALDLSQWGEYEATQDNGSSWAAGADRVTGGELQIVGTGTNPSGAGNVSGGVCWGCRGAGHRYGVWQVRARFDAGSGYAPVIGLWPNQGNSDNEGWLTVVNISQPARTSSGYAVRGPDGTSINGTVGGSLTGWHTYTIEWRSTYVKMYLDGTVIVDTTTNATHVTIPSVPMYLYIQQATGPSGSVPAPNGTTPAQVITHVDWVKYFG